MAPEYTIKTGEQEMQLDRICALLKTTYWADTRPRELIEKSIRHSIPYGVFDGQQQVGFGRVITDYATSYYICDIVIDPAYRGQGLGKMLVEAITTDERFCKCWGILATKDAHGLYKQYGFSENDTFMAKDRQ